MRKITSIILVSIILLSTLAFSGCISSSGSEGKDWSIAKKYIKTQFKYPSSVRFGTHKTSQHPGGNTFTGYVDAKNAFGMTKEYTYSISITNSSVTYCFIN